MYENDQRKKIDTLGDFDNKTPHAYGCNPRNFKI